MTAMTTDFSATGRITRAEAEDFIFTEAALADDHQYDGWEALWADNGVYWVPAANQTLEDPDSHISVIYDNRSRIALRVAQLKTGKRHAQDPVSSITRVISNIRLLRADPDAVETSANFIAVESRARGLTTWAGTVRHTLTRAEGGAIRMSRKVVLLVNRDQPIPTLAFLI